MAVAQAPVRPGQAERPPPPRWRAWLGVLLLAAAIGLIAGRFFLGGAGDAPAALPPVDLPASVASAIASRQAAVEANPSDLGALQGLGIAATQGASLTGDGSYYALAEDAFDRADELAADHPLTLVARANLQLSLHDFEAAYDLAEQALRAVPGNSAALGALVDAQVELGRYDAAAVTLQALLDSDPGLPALARTSYLRQLNGDLDGAILALRQAEAAGAGDPVDVATVAALRGDVALEAGDLDAAGAAYERAEDLTAGLAEAVIGRAEVLAVAGDFAGARTVLGPLVERAPTPAAATLLGEVALAAGDEAAAGDAFALVRASAALQADAGQVVDLEMALFEADHGDPAVGVELARAAHDARPDNVFAQAALAWALHTDGRGEEAADLARDALRLGTADRALRFRAATVLHAAGDTEAAREALRPLVERGATWTVLYRDAGPALAAELGLDGP